MIEYVQDVDLGNPINPVVRHVQAHLSAIADADDDPNTRADDVVIEIIDHPDDATRVRVVGTLDAEPVAPYLQPGYDPYANVDPALFEAEIDMAIKDEEVLRHGQA